VRTGIPYHKGHLCLLEAKCASCEAIGKYAAFCHIPCHKGLAMHPGLDPPRHIGVSGAPQLRREGQVSHILWGCTQTYLHPNIKDCWVPHLYGDGLVSHPPVGCAASCGIHPAINDWRVCRLLRQKSP